MANGRKNPPFRTDAGARLARRSWIGGLVLIFAGLMTMGCAARPLPKAVFSGELAKTTFRVELTRAEGNLGDEVRDGLVAGLGKHGLAVAEDASVVLSVTSTDAPAPQFFQIVVDGKPRLKRTVRVVATPIVLGTPLEPIEAKFVANDEEPLAEGALNGLFRSLAAHQRIESALIQAQIEGMARPKTSAEPQPELSP